MRKWVLAMAIVCMLWPAQGEAAGPAISAQARAFKPGEIVLFTVTGQNPKWTPSGIFLDRPVSFFQTASTGVWMSLAGIDLDASTGPHLMRATLHAANGKAVERDLSVVIEPASFPMVVLTVETKYVTPDKNDTERAESEAAALQKLFTKGEPKRLFEGSFAAPIPGAATGRFGERRVFNGAPRAPHSGMDLKAPAGKDIHAPAAGKVVLADSLFFLGDTIVLDHGLGVITIYAHLSKINAKTGSMVKKGDLLGKVGATGRVTGPHLHWALKVNGARVDPYSLTFLDLDALLNPRPQDPLKRSPICLSTAPVHEAWGRASGGLRGRARTVKADYAPGEPVSILVELQNIGSKATFLDFVRADALRPLVLGIGEAPQAFDQIAASRTATGPLTEQLRIPKKGILCFEQARTAQGPILAAQTTSYALTYGTEFLYASTSTARSGIWRGRLSLPPVTINVAPSAPTP